MSKNTRKLAIGALVAGAAGYLAGILTAPQSVKETRDDIKQAATSATREAEKRLKVLYGELAVLVDQGREHAGDLKAKARKELDGILDSATDAQDKIKDLLSAVRDGNAEDPELQSAIKDAEKLKDHLKNFLKRSNEVEN